MLLKNKAFGKSLLIVLATSVVIETIQFTFGLGAADIDDVLLNVLGGAVGFMGYKLLRKLFREPGKTRTAVTLISLVIGLPAIFVYLLICFRRYF